MQVINITHPNPSTATVTVELTGLELTLVRRAVLGNNSDDYAEVADALGVDFEEVSDTDGSLYLTLANICDDLGISL